MTVVIPVWGSYAEFVPRAVASARAQAGVDVRVVVVDNFHGTLITAPGCEVVRTAERVSTGAARNIGLSPVDSEYVVFLDVDDELVPGALARLTEGLDARPRGDVLVGRILDADGALFRAPRPLAIALARHPRAFAWANAAWSLLPTQGCTIMRTAAVRDAGGYGDSSSGEDWMLGARLAFRGPIAFDTRPALVYRPREDSPGSVRASGRSMLRNAARVRATLREGRVPGGAVAIVLLALAQWLAALVVHPLAILLRRAIRLR